MNLKLVSSLSCACVHVHLDSNPGLFLVWPKKNVYQYGTARHLRQLSLLKHLTYGIKLEILSVTLRFGHVLCSVVRFIERPAGIGSPKTRSRMASVASKMLLRNPSDHNILCTLLYHGNPTAISCEAVAGVILILAASAYRLDHHECYQELHGPIAGCSKSCTKDKPTNSLCTVAATCTSESSQWHNTISAASISTSCRGGNPRCTSIVEPSVGVPLPRQC